MTVMISLLRGINVGGHHKIKMDALRTLYQSLGLRDVQTHLQSGSVVFKSAARDPALLRKRLEDAIERAFSFHSDVVLRTTAELRKAVARNPFAERPGLEPGKLAVHFLAADPTAEARDALLRIKAEPEELRIDGSELYIYFPNGMGRPNLSMTLVEKTLKTSGTSRNWNTVRKLLEMAEVLETPTSST
jgi:uncharacterized protein (DUF1697 family)